MKTRLLMLLQLIILRFAFYELRTLGIFDPTQTEQINDLFEAAVGAVLTQRHP